MIERFYAGVMDDGLAGQSKEMETAKQHGVTRVQFTLKENAFFVAEAGRISSACQISFAV